MSISPINHYALTTAQPGVINEEAYTVLDLVGKCGSKVNECVAAVNEIEDYDDRITAAQETADEAASTARAALTTATENGQRITNVSAVALEGRSVAFSAQATAESANVIAEKVYSGMEEPKQIVFNNFTQTQYIDQYNMLTNAGILAVKSILNECFENIKINLTHPTFDQPNKTYSFRFGMRSNVFDSATLINNGYVDVVINVPNDATNVHCPFAFKIFMSVTQNYIMARGEGKIFSFESTGSILYADYTQNGIPPESYDFIHTGSGYENNEVQL